MITRKRVEGEVEHNDGEFAEVQTVVGSKELRKTFSSKPYKYTAVILEIRPKISGTGSRLA